MLHCHKVTELLRDAVLKVVWGTVRSCCCPAMLMQFRCQLAGVKLRLTLLPQCIIDRVIDEDTHFVVAASPQIWYFYLFSAYSFGSMGASTSAPSDKNSEYPDGRFYEIYEDDRVEYPVEVYLLVSSPNEHGRTVALAALSSYLKKSFGRSEIPNCTKLAFEKLVKECLQVSDDESRRHILNFMGASHQMSLVDCERPQFALSHGYQQLMFTTRHDFDITLIGLMHWKLAFKFPDGSWRTVDSIERCGKVSHRYFTSLKLGSAADMEARFSFGTVKLSKRTLAVLAKDNPLNGEKFDAVKVNCQEWLVEFLTRVHESDGNGGDHLKYPAHLDLSQITVQKQHWLLAHFCPSLFADGRAAPGRKSSMSSWG